MLRTVSARCTFSPQVIAKRLRSTKSRPKQSSKSHPKRTTNQKWSPAKRHHASSFFALPRPVDSPFLLPADNKAKGAPPANLAVDKCHDYFQQEVQNWSTDNRTLMRFARFGYPADAIRPFLVAYVSTAESGFFSSPENFAKYQLTRFASCGASYAAGGGGAADKPHLRLLDAEITFSNIFFSWVANMDDSGAALKKVVGEDKARREALLALRHLAVISERRPAEHFSWARNMKRKFIMHVGPTNSGKTYHALRALAAAKTGVYAGPLRLLAHEIWERLNLGQIVPLGIDVPPPSTSPPEKVPITDSYIAPAAKVHSNPAYARLTNMITGEERKLVAEGAPLMTCTIEMLSFRHQYEVGVIDEIQMIGDPQRGFAWTDAVLGLCAKEIHLCGEESAIPVIQELLKETGDELTVRRYERLTPLMVEDKSLEGDLSKTMKGDCVVAFSRSRIFEIKKEIEMKSGLRCAVVYGKLPPEIRSEQAALFNDPDSGFDVIIGSDAIGMGLNLKIRRMIFDQTSKPDSEYRTKALSISQIKQIAGRAGRYGHSLTGEKPGGYATTLYETDLPVLREALAQPTTPILTHAYIGSTIESFAALAPALLPRLSSSSNTTTATTSPTLVDLETAQMAHVYAALPPSAVYKYSHKPALSEICAWVEKMSKGEFTWDDKLQFMFSPISWRDEFAVGAAEEMAELQREKMCVFIESIPSIVGGGGKTGLVSALEEMENIMMKVEGEREREREKEKEGEGIAVGGLPSLQATLTNASLPSPPPTPSPLPLPPSLPSTSSPTVKIGLELLGRLEVLHKILVLYMWSHFRNGIVYPDRETAENLKNRVEVALDWGLRELRTDEEDITREREGRRKEELAEVGSDMGGYAGKMGKRGSTKAKAKAKAKGMDKEGKRRKGGDEKALFSRSTSRDGGRAREDYEGGFRSFENYSSRKPLPPLSRPSPRLSSLSPSSPVLASLLDRNPGPSKTIPPSSSGYYYPPPVRPVLSSRTSEVASAIANARTKSGVENSGASGAGGSSNVSPAGWTQAPDLTALLKMYVDNPGLRVDGGRGGSGNMVRK